MQTQHFEINQCVNQPGGSRNKLVRKADKGDQHPAGKVAIQHLRGSQPNQYDFAHT